VEVINQAITLGANIVGDNKVQEFNEKYPFIKGATYHFIGHLQTNKVKYLIGKVALIHSVDSLHLAQEISKQSVRKGVTTNILIEVNIGGELSKSGVDLTNAEEIIKSVSSLDGICLQGLMAMLPKSDDTAYLEKLCLQMRELYDKMNKKGYNFKYLSVGMSADYKIAIRCGSNMIRLGSSLFGKRDYQK
jgi:pyridoxal phosphate enzyme (YggS family)